jgi:hypothetical protein
VSALRRRWRSFFLLCVSGREPLYTSGRIQQFLLPRVKGVTVGANFHVQISHRRTRFKRIAANAFHDCFSIGWVNSFFHFELRCLSVFLPQQITKNRSEAQSGFQFKSFSD